MNPKHAPIALVVLLLAAVMPLAGCRSGPTPLEAAAGEAVPPPDFVLALTVLNPPGAVDPEQESARHVIEADHVLRTAVGAGVTPQTFPGRTRQLSEDEVESLWTILRDSGLLAPDHPAQIGGWRADRPPPLRPVYVVEYTVSGEHRTLVIDVASGGEGVRRLAEKLAELAWVG